MRDKKKSLLKLLKPFSTYEGGSSGINNRYDEQNTNLMSLIYKGLNKEALELIKTGQSNPGAVNAEGKTALMLATLFKTNEIALELIKTGQSNPGAVSKDGATALIIACMYKMPDIALEIINTGQSNPGAVDNTGNTALIYACGNKLSDVALELIKTGQSKPETVTNRGYTALSISCINMLPDVALELIKTGQSKPETVDENGNTALSISCFNNMSEVAIELIKTGQAKPEIVNNSGYTALMYTCLNNMSEVAIELIKTGQSNPEAENQEGDIALEFALFNGMKEVINLLNANILNAETELFNINDNGYNFVTMETLKIKDYLNENPENLCFKINNKYYLTNKQNIKTQLENIGNIKYGCIKAGDQLVFMDEPNIIYKIKYFALSSIVGLQIVVKKNVAEAAINNSNQIYSVFPTGKKLASIISEAILSGQGGMSADHCQPGKITEVYTLMSVNATEGTVVEPIVAQEQLSNSIKVQYKGKIFDFPMNNTITIGDIKKLLLDQLIAEGSITSANQNVKFIYKGKVYNQDEVKLTDIETDLTGGITLQSMVSPIVSGGKSKKRRGMRNKNKGTRRKTKKGMNKCSKRYKGKKNQTNKFRRRK